MKSQIVKAEAPEVATVMVREEALPLPTKELEARGPAPIGTLLIVGLVVLAIIWLWMLVLGIQQGRG